MDYYYGHFINSYGVCNIKLDIVYEPNNLLDENINFKIFDVTIKFP